MISDKYGKHRTLLNGDKKLLFQGNNEISLRTRFNTVYRIYIHSGLLGEAVQIGKETVRTGATQGKDRF